MVYMAVGVYCAHKEASMKKVHYGDHPPIEVPEDATTDDVKQAATDVYPELENANITQTPEGDFRCDVNFSTKG